MNNRKTGRVCWSSPANIALVKYWGKRGVQLPMNPSVSFALSKSKIKISVEYSLESGQTPGIDSFTLNGNTHDEFLQRIEKYLLALSDYFPFLQMARLKIDSISSFPHSAGIASSAAAFSALALCICNIRAELNDRPATGEDFFREASFVARLGSGSACRSVYGGLSVWGKTGLVAGSSDEYAVRLGEDISSPGITELNDSILIVDSSTKKVSSSGGHALMKEHPYKDARIEQAGSNLETIIRSIREGDIETFGQVVENEALSLHALMMSSSPGYLLLHPNTIKVIEKILDFRKDTGVPAYFTLDAGPNIHLVYRKTDHARVIPFIRDELLAYCENRRWLDDSVGSGPENLNEEI